MAWIHAVFFLFGMAGNVIQATKWVDNVTRNIAEESGASQAMLITKLVEKKGISSPIIDEVLFKLGQKLPVMRRNIANNQDEPDTSCVDAAGNPIPLSGTATFYLLIHDFRDAGTILPSTSIIDAIAKMATFDYHPKYLILSAASVLSESLEELLQYAWTKKILDLTILQWIETRVSRRFKSVNYEFSSPIVHQLDSFKQEYRRSNWFSNSGGLFPNKVNNMAGYPLRVVAANFIPFSVSAFNEFDEPVYVDGANIQLIWIIAWKLNASLKYIPYKISDNEKIKSSDFNKRYYDMGEYFKWDIASYLRARSSTSRCASLLTTTITVDELCAVVPILPTSARFNSTDLFPAFLVSFGIAVIYCIVAKVLRLSVRLWRPFTIARLFFGISVSQRSRRHVNRVLLTSLLVISSIYSSHIYSALTEISLFTTGEMVFESMDDLANSGLIPLVRMVDFNRTFYDAEGALRNLMEKSHWSINGVDPCLQQVAKEKNVTCFTDKSRAIIQVAKSLTNGHYTIKLAPPCFWSDSVAFDLGKRSPYRSSINVIISRMHNAGLINKLYEDA